VAAAAAKVALEAHAALGLGDLSRIDMIVATDGTPYVLEASVAPGMTDTSLVPMALSAAGLDLGQTMAVLAERAAARRR
jgi:D-alanine-D-alanine ligase